MPRIQLKLAAFFAILVAGLVFLTGYFSERDLRASAIRSTEVGLQDQARLVVELVDGLPFSAEAASSLRTRVRRAAEVTGARVTLFAPEGGVVVDSLEGSLAEVQARSPRVPPEVAAALEGRTGVAVRATAGIGGTYLYVAVPRAVSSGAATSAAGRPRGQGTGVVRLAVDLGDVALAVSSLRQRLLLAAALGLAAALLLAFVFAGFLAQPLERIRSTVAAIASGELSARVGWRSSDELGEIAAAVDRMGAELELRLREAISEKEQLQAVLSGMEEGVLMLDASGRIVLANRRLRELLGTSGELEGRTPLEVFRSVELDAALLETASSRSPVRREFEVHGPRRVIVSLRAVQLPREVGSGVVAVLDDRTELRRLEVVRRDFVANASHELRTPLTAIRGFAETLVDGDVSDEGRRKYLGIILEHAQRIGTLVDDLLELSRIESGKLELRARGLDLSEVVAKVLANLESLFEKRNLTVGCGDLDVPRVRADPQALEQILSNLLDNAAKYTEPGGRVWVRAEAVRSDAQLPGFPPVDPLGDRVRVLVEDTGIGIPESARARIFERFYRVDKARSRDLGGTGLGLSIVRHLVESMGGRIGVDSTPGKGSTFHFTLPVDRELHTK